MSLLIPDNIRVTSGGGHPYPGEPVFCDLQNHCRDDIDSSDKFMGSEREGLTVLLHDYFALLCGAKISVSMVRLFNPCDDTRGRVGDPCHRDSMGGEVVDAAVFFGVDEVFLFRFELVWCGVHV